MRISKAVRSILQFVIHLFLLAIALDGVLGGLWGIPEAPLSALLERYLPQVFPPVNETIARLLWLSVALVVVVYWILKLLELRAGPEIIHVRTREGETMKLPLGSVHSFVQMQINNHPAVTRSRELAVRQSSAHGISIACSIFVKPIKGVPAIKREVKETVRTSLSTVLGIETIDDEDYVISLDPHALQSRPGPNKQAKRMPEPPVRGEIEDQNIRFTGPPADVEARTVPHEHAPAGSPPPEDASIAAAESAAADMQPPPARAESEPVTAEHRAVTEPAPAPQEPPKGADDGAEEPAKDPGWSFLGRNTSEPETPAVEEPDLEAHDDKDPDTLDLVERGEQDHGDRSNDAGEREKDGPRV